MNPELLETLIAVADTGGYTPAARQLAVSQPAVYQRLQRLEALAGTPLLQRAGRRFELTPNGQVLYQHARSILKQFRLLEDAIVGNEELSGGRALSLLVGHSLCEFPIPDICSGFQQQHPGLIVDFRVNARPPRDIDRQLSLGRADIGIHSDPTPVTGLCKDGFYREEYVALACNDHRFRQLDVVRPQDFVGEAFIAFQDVTFTFSQGQVEGWFARGGVEPHHSFVSNSVIAIRELVARRNGVAIVPREHAVQEPNLLVRPLVDPPHRTHYVVTRSTPYEAASAQRFREYVLSRSWLPS